jgi:hypothetical protein
MDKATKDAQITRDAARDAYIAKRSARPATFDEERVDRLPGESYPDTLKRRIAELQQQLKDLEGRTTQDSQPAHC